MGLQESVLRCDSQLAHCMNTLAQSAGRMRDSRRFRPPPPGPAPPAPTGTFQATVVWGRSPLATPRPAQRCSVLGAMIRHPDAMLTGYHSVRAAAADVDTSRLCMDRRSAIQS
eukprot:jgi/Ulvmu1/837/UM010_0211.1